MTAIGTPALARVQGGTTITVVSNLQKLCPLKQVNREFRTSWRIAVWMISLTGKFGGDAGRFGRSKAEPQISPFRKLSLIVTNLK